MSDENGSVVAGPCVVVGYDRTDSARRAVEWAAAELPANGRLVLVHACRPLHAPPSPLTSAEERRQFGRALIDELLLESDDPLIDAEVCVEVSDEDPVTALTDAARRHEARTIVVGCEQHSRLHRAIGTVTSELLRSSPVPVTAVPSTSGPAVAQGGAAAQGEAGAHGETDADAASDDRGDAAGS
jgi:nucleotide-binding universal stress UspA family protein